ncbi:MAG: putative Zn-dependent protease [Oceanicoccus sp.]|jgi:predicted Zn-dependent protease
MNTLLTRSLSICLLLLMVGCAISPTGRKQLLIFPSSEMNQVGVAAFSDIKKKLPVEKQVTTNIYVNCVADAVIAILPANTLDQWEVVVFKDDSANAFALPGSKIGVHSGLLTVAVNQSQLATVIGHEIGHVISRHGNERLSIQFASQTSQQLMGVMMQGRREAGLVMAAMGVGAQVGVQLPYSRAHEAEADVIGLELMAKAGFDPRASVALWNNMAAGAKGEAPAEIMSTHPSNSSRIAGLQANMGPALNFYDQARAQGKRPNCRK